MSSDPSVDAAETAAKYRRLQEEALSAYSRALADALKPLEERYKKALGNLADIQNSYYQELGTRLTAAYKSYGETVSAILPGSPKLEPAVEAYNAFLGRYSAFADPGRWAEMVAPALDKLSEALADARGEYDAALQMQQAVETFYSELNVLLQADPAAKELSDAQSNYAAQLQELHADVSRGWQQAIETVGNGVKEAVAESGSNFDIDAGLKEFAVELKTIGEDLADAYREAAEAATNLWGKKWSDEDAAKAAEMARGATIATAATTSPALAASSAPVAAAASPAVATAMASSPTTMPRASWVNVPEPAADKKSHTAGTGSKKKSTSRGSGSATSRRGSSKSSGKSGGKAGEDGST